MTLPKGVDTVVINPDNINGFVEEMKQQGYPIATPPQTSEEFAQAVEQSAKKRWSIRQLEFTPLEGSLEQMWANCRDAYICGLDIAALSTALVIIEGLLRSAFHQISTPADLPINEVDVDLVTRQSGLRLASLTKRAEKHGLISEETGEWLRAKIAKTRNALLHGNIQQLIHQQVGPEYEFDTKKINLDTGTVSEEKLRVREAKWIGGAFLHEFASANAPALLQICCELSAQLKQTIDAKKAQSSESQE